MLATHNVVAHEPRSRAHAVELRDATYNAKGQPSMLTFPYQDTQRGGSIIWEEFPSIELAADYRLRSQDYNSTFQRRCNAYFPSKDRSSNAYAKALGRSINHTQ